MPKCHISLPFHIPQLQKSLTSNLKRAHDPLPPPPLSPGPKKFSQHLKILSQQVPQSFKSAMRNMKLMQFISQLIWTLYTKHQQTNWFTHWTKLRWKKGTDGRLLSLWNLLMVLWEDSLQRDFALEQDQRHPNQMPLVQVKCFPMKNHELCLTLLQSCAVNCFLIVLIIQVMISSLSRLCSR